LISIVKTTDDLAQARALFSEYATSIDIDLSFQDFGRELANLPGEYTPPGGCIFLARMGSEAVDCVALRRISEEICEMKRLYVKPAFRKRRIGRRLCEVVIEEARSRGYQIMKLDTIPSMVDAISLYTALGFTRTIPYRYNPVKGAMFMHLDLAAT